MRQFTTPTSSVLRVAFLHADHPAQRRRFADTASAAPASPPPARGQADYMEFAKRATNDK
jgi:hypothetical protein